MVSLKNIKTLCKYFIWLCWRTFDLALVCWSLTWDSCERERDLILALLEFIFRIITPRGVYIAFE